MEKLAFGRFAVFLGSAVALTWSLPAKAQEFLKDRTLQDGPGYQAGEFDIHPGIAGEIGYDSNYYERSDKVSPNYVNAAPNLPPEGTGELRITPSLIVSSVPSTQRREFSGASGNPPVTFTGTLSGTYREFLNSDLSNQRNMSANAVALLAVRPGRPWSFSLNASWARTIQPTVIGDPDASYNNDSVSGGVDLAIQPNMGTLDWHFGYQFTGVFFEDSIATPYNNVLNTVYTRGRWRFRPKTALLYEGSIGTRTYSGDSNNAVFALHTTTPVSTALGLEGLVTSRISVLLMGGYSGTFTSGADASVQQYDSFNARAEVRYYPGSASTGSAPGQGAQENAMVSLIALGYQRTLQASYLNDFYGVDRGYLHADYSLAGRFLFRIEGGVGSLEHPDLYFSSSVTGGGTPVLMHAAYTDIRADASFYVEYRIIPSVALTGTLSYVENFSNADLPVTSVDAAKPAGTGNYYDQSFRDFQAFFGVRWLM